MSFTLYTQSVQKILESTLLPVIKTAGMFGITFDSRGNFCTFEPYAGEYYPCKQVSKREFILNGQSFDITPYCESNKRFDNSRVIKGYGGILKISNDMKVCRFRLPYDNHVVYGVNVSKNGNLVFYNEDYLTLLLNNSALIIGRSTERFEINPRRRRKRSSNFKSAIVISNEYPGYFITAFLDKGELLITNTKDQVMSVSGIVLTYSQDEVEFYKCDIYDVEEFKKLSKRYLGVNSEYDTDKLVKYIVKTHLGVLNHVDVFKGRSVIDKLESIERFYTEELTNIRNNLTRMISGAKRIFKNSRSKDELLENKKGIVHRLEDGNVLTMNLKGKDDIRDLVLTMTLPNMSIKASLSVFMPDFRNLSRDCLSHVCKFTCSIKGTSNSRLVLRGTYWPEGVEIRPGEATISSEEIMVGEGLGRCHMLIDIDGVKMYNTTLPTVFRILRPVFSDEEFVIEVACKHKDSSSYYGLTARWPLQEIINNGLQVERCSPKSIEIYPRYYPPINAVEFENSVLLNSFKLISKCDVMDMMESGNESYSL